MIQTEKSSDVLAHWIYEPDLWRDFSEYESKVYKGSVRAAKHLFFGLIIFTVFVFLFFLFVRLLIRGEWDWKNLLPALGIGAVAGILFCWPEFYGFTGAKEQTASRQKQGKR
jgi:hypothetical protein